MHDSLCERCGNAATVTVASVGPSREGRRAPRAPQHRYCRDCARAVGVRIPQRPRDVNAVTEPELLSWPEVEQQLALYEQLLQEEPNVREQVSMMVGLMRRYSNQIPGAMPVAVAQAFERLGA